MSNEILHCFDCPRGLDGLRLFKRKQNRCRAPSQPKGDRLPGKQALKVAQSDAAALVPTELLDFLRKHSGEKFAFESGKHTNLEVEQVSFVAPQNLRLAEFTVSMFETCHKQDMLPDDPELEYAVEGIDLVADCGEHYDADGILIWFPGFQEYGYWDPDHRLIGLFPKANWSTISGNLSLYINAQWDNSLVKCHLLKPWSDKRCDELKLIGDDSRSTMVDGRFVDLKNGFSIRPPGGWDIEPAKGKAWTAFRGPEVGTEEKEQAVIRLPQYGDEGDLEEVSSKIRRELRELGHKKSIAQASFPTDSGLKGVRLSYVELGKRRIVFYIFGDEKHTFGVTAVVPEEKAEEYQAAFDACARSLRVERDSERKEK